MQQWEVDTAQLGSSTSARVQYLEGVLREKEEQLEGAEVDRYFMRRST